MHENENKSYAAKACELAILILDKHESRLYIFNLLNEASIIYHQSE